MAILLVTLITLMIAGGFLAAFLLTLLRQRDMLEPHIRPLIILDKWGFTSAILVSQIGYWETNSGSRPQGNSNRCLSLERSQIEKAIRNVNLMISAIYIEVK